MNEYTCYGKGHTIHSSGQIEWFKISVDDRSVQVGGRQRICTIDGYAINRNMSKSTLQSSLLTLWMDENSSQQSNKNLLMMKNLQILFDATTKLSQIVPTWLIETGVLNR